MRGRRGHRLAPAHTSPAQAVRIRRPDLRQSCALSRAVHSAGFFDLCRGLRPQSCRVHALPASLPTAVAVKGLAIGAGLVLAAAAGAVPRPAKPPQPVPAEVASVGAMDGPVGYQAPLPLPLQVVRGFDPPVTKYGAGHLGVDLGVSAHAPIRSAGPGLVSFAGPVAGRGVVVVSHPDGVRTEYEPVRPLVRRGDAVQAGTVIGLLSGRHPGCPITACLHWGARRGDAYIDPLGLLAPLGPVRLLPWDP